MYPAKSPNMDDCVLTSSEKVGRCSASALKHCIIKEYLRINTYSPFNLVLFSRCRNTCTSIKSPFKHKSSDFLALANTFGPTVQSPMQPYSTIISGILQITNRGIPYNHFHPKLVRSKINDKLPNLILIYVPHTLSLLQILNECQNAKRTKLDVV